MPEPKLSPRVLAWSNLRRRPFRTACLTGIVALFSFILFGGAVLNKNLSQGLDSLAGRLGADMLVVPHGYEQQTQAALLRGEPSTFYLKADLVDKVRSAPGVLQATPQFFLASLNAACCSAKVQIIGYDPVTDFLVKPWTLENHGTLQPGQVTAGSRIAAGVGEEIILYGVSYMVAAKMEPTGMGFDTSIFMTMDDIHRLLRTEGVATGDVESADDFISSIAVKADPAFPIRDIANELMRRYAIDYDLDMVLTKNMIADIATRLTNLASLVWILAAGLLLMAMVIMSIIFSSILNERKREISLFRILGATRGWLSRMMLLEACYIGFGGALLGLAAAALVIFPFSSLIFQSIGLPHLQLSGPLIAGYALTVFLAAGSVGPLASVYSVMSITRFDIYQTLREGD